MTKRTIAIFTGNRAEYGLQFPIIKAISQDPRLEYRLIVSGAHLKADFGRSVAEIEKDGFHVDAHIDIETGGDNLKGTALAIGSCIQKLAPVLADMRPDAMVVYADRFESFGALVASTQMGIPTAHAEGGDLTEGGALDDMVRHAMTKLAHLHFTTNDEASQRILRMGEEPWRVKNVGFPALDLIAAGLYAKREDVFAKYGLDPARPVLVFTQHSVATEFDEAAAQVRPSLAALEEAVERFGCQVVVTYPNDDAGGRAILQEIQRSSLLRRPGVQLHASLGRFNYHGLLAIAAACIGNSSSGIKETPIFRCPCIDIGSRQQGRLRAENVLNPGYDQREILAAINRCLHDEAFRERVRTCVNPYGAGNAGPQIAEILATIPLDRALIQKKMTY